MSSGEEDWSEVNWNSLITEVFKINRLTIIEKTTKKIPDWNNNIICFGLLTVDYSLRLPILLNSITHSYDYLN